MRVVPLSFMIALLAMPAAAWERTTQTKVAADGTPLVKLIAEPGDMLGEPWLEYLRSIDYDTSGNWWVESAQTLLNYNPDGAFVPGTNYGIGVGTSWWLPDVQVLQTAATSIDSLSDTNPVMRQTDFLALAEAVANDIADIEEYQQAAEERLAARITALEDRVTATEGRVAVAQTSIDDLEANQQTFVGQLSDQSNRLAEQASRLDQFETFQRDLDVTQFVTQSDINQSLIDVGLLNEDGSLPVATAQAEPTADLQQLRDEFSTEGLVTTKELDTRLSELDDVPESVNSSPAYWLWLTALAGLLLAAFALVHSRKLKTSVDTLERGLQSAHTKVDQTHEKTKENTIAIEALASRFKHKVDKIEEGQYRTLLPADIKKLEVGDEFIYHILVDDQPVPLSAKVERKTAKGEAVVVIMPFAGEPPLKVGTKNLYTSLSDLIEKHGIPDTIKVSEPNTIAAG